MSCSSVRHFPSLSYMVVVRSCFVLVRSFTSWYVFLLLFFFMLSLMSWHCSSIQFIFAFFMPFLISWLAALYCLTPSASFFFFFNSLRLSHRSSKSAVTQGFLTGRCLPRISLAVLVTAVLKVSINVSCLCRQLQISLLSLRGRLLLLWGPSASQVQNLILAWPSFWTLFRCSLKIIMTSSWSLPMSAP